MVGLSVAEVGSLGIPLCFVDTVMLLVVGVTQLVYRIGNIALR